MVLGFENRLQVSVSFKQIVFCKRWLCVKLVRERLNDAKFKGGIRDLVSKESKKWERF